MITVEGFVRPISAGIIAVIVIGSVLLVFVALCLVVPCVCPDSIFAYKMQSCQDGIKESCRRKKPLRQDDVDTEPGIQTKSAAKASS